MRKEKKIYRTIMLIIVVALVTFILTTCVMSNNTYKKDGSYTNISENLKLNTKLNTIKKIINEDFLGEVDETKLTEAAIKGYVEGLDDEYTEYFTKEEMEEFKTETEGNYVGIGIYMLKNTKDNNIIVLSAIKGSPAEEAGLKTGDIIKKVNDKEYTAEEFEKIASDIKGKAGSKVKLEIQRGEETLTFEIERKKIELYPIESEVLENDIGYINISSFCEDCSSKFKENYDKLKRKNIKSLVIDLRNNGGGIVDEALEILDSILDKDSIMLITANKKGEEKIEKAKKKPTIEVPIVVLVNENTASSSEIFAAALKENNKAKIIGTKTYGKGVIQESITLSDGSGIKITTEEYYTPNRNKINKIGITPDIEVDLEEKTKNITEISRDQDTQLKKAIETLK